MAALMLLGLAGCNADSLATSSTPSAERSESAAVAGPGGPVRVKTLQPTRTTLVRTTTQPATVHANQQADIHAKVSGYLQAWSADIGDRVEAGALLARIDVPELRKQRERQALVVQQYEAAEQRAAAEEALAEARVQSSAAQLEQARSEVARETAQLNASQSEFNRVQELVKTGSVEGRLADESRQRLEAAQAGKAAAESAVTSADAAVRVTEAQRVAAAAMVKFAEAETNVARKQLEELDELLKYAELTAPFDGVVTQRNVDVGDLVRNTQSGGAGSPPLFTVAQIDTVRIRAAVPEADAPFCQPGDKVRLRVASQRGAAIEAQVARVSRALDRSTRTMLVEVDVPNPDGRLLPGMYGEATIVLAEHPDVLTLPASAVRHSETGAAFVYTVDAAGAVQIVEVTTGLDDGRQIEIVSGLDPDARVIDALIGRLEPGQKVQVQ